MDLIITDLAVNPGETLNISTIVGLAGGVIGVLGALFGAYIWLIDRKKRYWNFSNKERGF